MHTCKPTSSIKNSFCFEFTLLSTTIKFLSLKYSGNILAYLACKLLLECKVFLKWKKNIKGSYSSVKTPVFQFNLCLFSRSVYRYMMSSVDCVFICPPIEILNISKKYQLEIN